MRDYLQEKIRRITIGVGNGFEGHDVNGGTDQARIREDLFVAFTKSGRTKIKAELFQPDGKVTGSFFVTGPKDAIEKIKQTS